VNKKCLSNLHRILGLISKTNVVNLSKIGLGSGIWNPSSVVGGPRSSGQKGTETRIPDPGSGSATMLVSMHKQKKFYISVQTWIWIHCQINSNLGNTQFHTWLQCCRSGILGSVFWPPGSGSGLISPTYGSYWGTIPSIKKQKKVWKTLFLLFCNLLLTFYLLKMMLMYLPKVISIKAY
jgi:hypothetical protein